MGVSCSFSTTAVIRVLAVAFIGVAISGQLGVVDYSPKYLWLLSPMSPKWG